MKKVAGLAAAVSLALVVVAGAGAGWSDAPRKGGVDTSSAIVQLKGDPLSTYVKTKPAPGKKIDFDSNSVKSYRAQLNQLRNDFKKWLKQNAPKAKVTGEFDIAVNAVSVQLHGTSLDTIKTAPQVESASYEALYSPTGDDPDLGLIHAVEAWGGTTSDGARAGAGVKVGIIDTGIDVTHPCFADTGFPSTKQLGDQSLTNNKVIVAKVFYNKAKQQGLTAEAIQDHGTHVAGTVACDYGLTNDTTTVDGVTVPYGVLGVAPGAQLGNYNVFPGDVENARSEDILNALEAAYADGMDVVNLSLGGDAHGVQDLLTNAIDDLDQAGMISAVAAGNSGPGHLTVESPGSAARALTAGAMTVGHFIGSPVTVDGETYGAATGDFATVDSDLTAPLAVVTGDTNGLDTACSTLSAPLSGKIALISRGTCTFSVKIRNAEKAGAVAVLVANNVAGDPTAMASDGTADQPTVPAYMVALSTGQALLGSDGESTTIGAGSEYIPTPNANIMAGFSSQGPTDVDFRVKPDVVAPGVNVLSSIPHTFCDHAPCWAFFQGTSMATPHLAGSAAVVLGQHRGWSAAQVRSAIVNTADQGVLTDSQTGKDVVTDVNVVGAGRENLAAAVHAQVALDPVSLSFGAVPSGSGQTLKGTIALSQLNGSATGVDVANGASDGVTFSASLSGSTITVMMSAAKGASKGDHQATLRVLSGGTEVAHAALYVLIK